MDSQKLKPWTRREFIGRMTSVSVAGAFSLYPEIVKAEPPPETTSINIVFDPTFAILCYGPQYVATEMLKLEGFTEVNYTPYLPNQGLKYLPTRESSHFTISRVKK